MTRYKGRSSSNSIERDFPYIIEIVVPPNSLGAKLDAMYDFHARHGIQPSAVIGGMMLTAVLFDGCVYRNPKYGRNGDAAHLR